MTALGFDGQVAIVTGAGRGMGRSHALMLAARGCRLVVNDLAAAGDQCAAQVVEEIRAAGGEAVADTHSVVGEAASIVEAALAAFGRLDIVVNNAGVLASRSFAETPAAEWHRVADVHYRGTVEMCRAAWPLLSRAGGAIINVASSGMLGNAGLTSYGSAKAAIFGFSRSLALEGAPLGIRVNCIMPTARTRMTDEIQDPGVADVLRQRFQPEHVSALVTWLAHPGTRVNNETFRVGAGSAARIVLAQMPPVHADASTPEAWRAVERALLAEGPLTPLFSTADLFGRELQDADPHAATAAGGQPGGLSINNPK